MMIFHLLFNLHSANLKTSHWEDGRFVTNCSICGRQMVKAPGDSWKIALDHADR